MAELTVAVVQARTSSSRLPQKVMMPILGRPMLAMQLERLRRCKTFDHLVVATSTDPSDDLLAELCSAEKTDCFRGNLTDVLDRFVGAAKPYKPDIVVRLTGDCPLTDPILIDDVVTAFKSSRADYMSNCEPPTYPDGLDVEVTRFSCLETAWREAVLPSHREHVTPFIRRQPDRFRVENYADTTDRSGMRWTVDEAEDFEFVKQVYQHLYSLNPGFSTTDVLALLAKHPALAQINARFERNEGSKKSVKADHRFLEKTQNDRTL